MSFNYNNQTSPSSGPQDVSTDEVNANNERDEAAESISPMLDVRNLCKYFSVESKGFGLKNQLVKAVDDVSFTIQPGEVVGLVGESGSGKTTVGRCVLRMSEPTSGEVIFEGRDIRQLSKEKLRELRRDMQIVFQDPYASLNPQMRVVDLIGEGIIAHGLAPKKEVKDRVAELLETVGLAAHHMMRYIHEFSGGQRQRIGIARALALNPRFIVADEPVSALDVSVQVQVLNLMKDLQKDRDLTMLMVAHDLGVVEYISDRVIVMYLGKIMEVASVDDLFRNPQHPYTEALLSSVPITNPRDALSRKRTLLQGDIPSPLDPPSGCVFRTRCPIATAECAKVVPALESVGSNKTHMKACIHR